MNDNEIAEEETKLRIRLQKRIILEYAAEIIKECAAINPDYLDTSYNQDKYTAIDCDAMLIQQHLLKLRRNK